MRIFICWSGTRSQGVAAALKGFFQQLNEALPDPAKLEAFYSPDIGKGLRWFEAVAKELGSADVALLTLTPENAKSPWMHYEAGAIASHMMRQGPERQKGNEAKARIFTYLFGMDPRDLDGPLAEYQATVASYPDTRALVQQLLREHVDQLKKEEDFRKCWDCLAENLRLVRWQPFAEVIHGFEQMFLRKTFQEPSAECHRQAWIERMNGCRDTYRELREHTEDVKARCQYYVGELYQQLLASLDAYEQALQAYLVMEKQFLVGKDGRLIFPAGVEDICEERRRHVRDAVAALLDPGRAPVFDESPSFARLETFAEKKNLIHRKSGAIRNWIEKQKRKGGQPDADPRMDAVGQDCVRITQQRDRDFTDWRETPLLPTAAAFERAAESDWEFDRIAYYLTHSECVRQKFQPEKAKERHGLLINDRLEDRLCQWLDEEIQKIRAHKRPGEASRMPLSYALGVFEDMFGHLKSSTVQDAKPVLEDILAIEAKIDSSQIRIRVEALLKRINQHEGSERMGPS